MKYLIKYTVGNGYHCGCCRHETNYDETFYDLEEAIKFVAKFIIEEDFKLNDITPIPESPEDFIKNEFDEFEVAFDRYAFNSKVKELSGSLAKQAEKEKALQKSLDDKKKQEALEKAEKEQLELLLSKYGSKGYS